MLIMRQVLETAVLAAIAALAPLSANAAGNIQTLTGSPAIVGGQLLYCPTTGLADYKCTFNQVATFINQNLNVSSGGSYLYNSVPIANAQTALNNYFFGAAGNLTMTGSNNTASGNHALYSNTTGGNNTASGFDALVFNTTGSNNTASGFEALYSNTTGGGNTASGNDVLEFNTTGGNNTASGSGALYNNTTGGNNTASGFDALYDYNDATAASDNNSAFGYNTGRGLVTGVNNTILGANVTGLTSALSNAIILATGDGTIRADFGKTAASAWTMAFLVGTGSRPVCVTSAGTLEAGSLSVGLVTCP